MPCGLLAYKALAIFFNLLYLCRYNLFFHKDEKDGKDAMRTVGIQGVSHLFNLSYLCRIKLYFSNTFSCLFNVISARSLMAFAFSI